METVLGFMVAFFVVFRLLKLREVKKEERDKKLEQERIRNEQVDEFEKISLTNPDSPMWDHLEETMKDFCNNIPDDKKETD